MAWPGGRSEAARTPPRCQEWPPYECRDRRQEQSLARKTVKHPQIATISGPNVNRDKLVGSGAFPNLGNDSELRNQALNATRIVIGTGRGTVTTEVENPSGCGICGCVEGHHTASHPVVHDIQEQVPIRRIVRKRRNIQDEIKSVCPRCAESYSLREDLGRVGALVGGICRA